VVGRMNEDVSACGTWVMSAYEHVTHMNDASCDTHNRVTLQHMPLSHATFEWVMSRMYESCHVGMRHDAHMAESCHVRMSHVTCKWVVYTRSHDEWVMSHMNESCPIWMSHVKYEFVVYTGVSRWMSHVTYDWVMSLSHMQEPWANKTKLEKGIWKLVLWNKGSFPGTHCFPGGSFSFLLFFLPGVGAGIGLCLIVYAFVCADKLEAVGADSILIFSIQNTRM